jgi:spore maturation protein CgeB
MRIFYASANSPNPEFGSNLWRRNLLETLVSIGHDVVEFDYDMRATFRNLDASHPGQRKFIAKNRPLLSAELLRQIRAAHAIQPIHLFFSYFYDACVEPAAIDEIKSLGITTVNWFCNASFQLSLVSEISTHYDWCLVPEKFRLSDYVSLGARPIYCQEAANPKYYLPHDVKQKYDVTFVGQANGDRPSYIKYLYESGVDVRVWGTRWEYHVVPRSRNPLKRWFYKRPGLPASRHGGVLSDDELVKMYSRSRINLGFSTCGESHVDDVRIVQIRLRDFEIPMSGGFYLVEYQPELEEFFEVGKEIECYRDQEELLDKCRFYLRNDVARDKIRTAGRNRCLRDHTWKHRFETSFEAMGLQ